MATTKNVRVSLIPVSYTWARLPRSIRHMMKAEALITVRRAVNNFFYEG